MEALRFELALFGVAISAVVIDLDISRSRLPSVVIMGGCVYGGWVAAGIREAILDVWALGLLGLLNRETSIFLLIGFFFFGAARADFV